MPTTPRRTYESLAHAALRTDMSIRTMRRHIANGDLPAYRCGRLIRADPDDVDRMMVRIPTARPIGWRVQRGGPWSSSEADYPAVQTPC